MRKSPTLVRSTVRYDITTCEKTPKSITGGSRNGGGRAYPTMRSKMLNNSGVTMILHRGATIYWIFGGFGEVG